MTTPGNAQIPSHLIALVSFLDAYFRNDPIIFEWEKPDAPRFKIRGGKAWQQLQLDLTHYTAGEIAVYRALVTVPQGATVSYGLLGQLAGFDRAGRFVGNAMRKNSFPILIPCHRVIRSDGAMGHYSGGAGLKEALLAHEARGGFGDALAKSINN